MLTAEENALLTRIGPGPAGELLRRYWFPCAVARELTDESPTKSSAFSGRISSFSRIRAGRSV